MAIVNISLKDGNEQVNIERHFSSEEMKQSFLTDVIDIIKHYEQMKENMEGVNSDAETTEKDISEIEN